MSKSHHFRGTGQYAEQLMDLAEGRSAFTGRGQKPSNHDVLAAIAAIKKCRQGAFFQPSASRPCSCGWHTKAAARKRARQAQSRSSSSIAPALSSTSASASSPSPSVHPTPSPSVPPATGAPAASSISSPSPPVPPATTTASAASLSPSIPFTATATAASSSPSPTPPITNIPTTPSSSRDLPVVGTGPVPPKFDRSDFQSPTIGELRTIGIGTKTSPGKLDMLVYCPLTGRCPHCKSALVTANSVGKRKLCYAIPWPKTIVGVDMRCGKCKKHFMTHDTSYVETLPTAEQIKREFVTAKGNGSHASLLRLLRSGLIVAQVQRVIEDEVREHYLMLKSKYIELWDKVDAMRGVGKVNVAPRDAFPPFPSHYVPCRPHITAMFVKDYWENKPHIMRELRTILSSHSLAVDHQRKVVKRTLGGDVVGHGGQTFTICGDFGLICGVYVVPDTALSWARQAMSEVIDRHQAAGVEVPKSLYMDCGCCSGRATSHQSTSSDTTTKSTSSDTTTKSTSSDTTTSVAALWRSLFSVRLDAMHLMLRIGREMNAEHPRRKKILVDLSHAIFVQHEGDRQQLMREREAAGLEGPPTRTERVKFIRRVVGEPESVAERMILVLKAHKELDVQCRTQAQAAGMEVDNISVAGVAYPLITRRLIGVFQQQLVHVRNGCISDDPDHLPYVKVGTINFHSTGHHLAHYRSLCGTSKVEAVHSVLDRTFYSQRGIGTEVFDARSGWWILGYNRRCLRTLGKKVPPDSMSPKVCEHYIGHGLCTDFPEWSIAAPGSESTLKIGYDYGRLVTGEQLQIEPDLDEEAVRTDDDQIVPDQSMVVTSAEALQELGLDTVDLVDEESSVFQPTSLDQDLPSTSTASNEMEVDVTDAGVLADEAPFFEPTRPQEDDSQSTAAAAIPGWKSASIPDASPGRRRNISRLRAMGGDPTCVPPDFNSSMLAVWEELWHAMPQSGRVGVTVNTLLQRYKEHCSAERKRPRQPSEGPPSLLPVSFAQAKDWLLRQQKAQQEALQTGAVNEDAREVVADLSRSLSEQPASTAALLEQPARPASPVVPPPAMSLGPEPVTNETRAEERAEERAQKKANPPPTASRPKKPAAKKRKVIPPELEERQRKAAARKLELGVPPIQEKDLEGKRPCPVCHQLRTASDKSPDGLIHRVLGRSNQIWCPYADDKSILEAFEKEQKERTQAAWRRANEAKKLKKMQSS